jgi:hypothetical protein
VDGARRHNALPRRGWRQPRRESVHPVLDDVDYRGPVLRQRLLHGGRELVVFLHAHPEAAEGAGEPGEVRVAVEDAEVAAFVRKALSSRVLPYE